MRFPYLRGSKPSIESCEDTDFQFYGFCFLHILIKYPRQYYMISVEEDFTVLQYGLFCHSGTVAFLRSTPYGISPANRQLYRK